jgi:hypothetical protein
LFFKDDEYHSYVTNAILHNDDNYLLPVYINCKNNKINEINVKKYNGDLIVIKEKDMITGSPMFLWVLQHLFKTLTWENNFRMHFTINHQITFLMRTKLEKDFSSMNELQYIANDIAFELKLASDNTILSNFFLKKTSPFFFTFDNFLLYTKNLFIQDDFNFWLFKEMPFCKIINKKPIHYKMIKSYIIISDYISNKYPNNIHKDNMRSFLFHSLVISSFSHINVTSELYADYMSDSENKPNKYYKYNIWELLLTYGFGNNEKNIFLWGVPADICNLRKEIQNIFDEIPIGFSHKKSLLEQLNII